MTETAGRSGRTIEKEIVIAASPERVFAALTEARELEGWFALQVVSDPRPGGVFEVKWANVQATGRYLEVDSPHRFVSEWDEGEALGTTLLTVTVTPVDGGSLVRFVQSGFGSGDDWDALYDGLDSGWPAALADLKSWIETGVVPVDGFRTG